MAAQTGLEGSAPAVRRAALQRKHRDTANPVAASGRMPTESASPARIATAALPTNPGNARK